MDKREVAIKAEKIIVPVIESLGFSFVDCEYVTEFGRQILRVYIEKNDASVSLNDCEQVSRSLEGVLDVEDVIPSRYVLEVSSPGLDRPLRKLADFERFKGHKIRLKTRAPIDGRANYYGFLLGVNGSDILMNVDNKEYVVPIDMLLKANLEFEIKKQERQKRR